MSTTQLSIIVPVYNVEPYLKRCLDSIVAENESGVEVLLIDDGSTDASGRICDEYAAQHAAFHVFHKANGGLSDARNYGMARAVGEYLLFMDSDDYLIKGSLPQLTRLMRETGSDVIVGQSLVTYDSGKAENEAAYSIKPGTYTSAAYARALRKNRKSVSFCAQYHICRRTFLTDNGLLFRPGILHEDELWTPQVLLRAASVCYAGVLFYCHYMREGSIMHSDNYARRGDSLIVIAEELLRVFDESGRRDLQYYRDRMAGFLLQAPYMVRGDERLRRMRTVPLKNAHYFGTFLKAFLYAVSPRFYIFLHDRLKGK